MFTNYMHDLQDCIAPSGTNCSICLGSCDSIQYPVVRVDHGATHCYFHRGCIVPWFNDRNCSCPNDRLQVWRPNQITEAQAVAMADPADPLPLLEYNDFDNYINRINNLSAEIDQARVEAQGPIAIINDWREMREHRRELRNIVRTLHHPLTHLRLGIFPEQATGELRDIRWHLRRWRRRVESRAPAYIAIWPMLLPFVRALHTSGQLDDAEMQRLWRTWRLTDANLRRHPDDISLFNDVYLFMEQLREAISQAGYSNQGQLRPFIDNLPAIPEGAPIPELSEDEDMQDILDEDSDSDDSDYEYGSEWETDEHLDDQSDDEPLDPEEEEE